MPGLHFLGSGQVSFIRPSPLLINAILYVAAAHSTTPELAKHQPVYFAAFCRVIGTLLIPEAPGAAAPDEEPFSDDDPLPEFDNVLAIILVGLLAVGWVDTVGTWVSIAYRLLLDGMAAAKERGKRQVEWRGLWEGLRVRHIGSQVGGSPQMSA